MTVEAAIAGDETGYYSRRDRKDKSGGRFPAGRSRTPAAGRVATAIQVRLKLKPDTTY